MEVGKKKEILEWIENIRRGRGTWAVFSSVGETYTGRTGGWNK